MSLKPTGFRADAEACDAAFLRIILGSDNGCGVALSDSDSDADSDSDGKGPKGSIIARFRAKVRFDGPTPFHCAHLGPCWLWTANRVRGYGQLVLPRNGRRQRHVYAHRFAYELAIGPLGAASALHRCDNPVCVRPSHLFAGTQQDNLADARAKGRLDESRPRMSRAMTPLDRQAIYDARRYRGVCVDLARQYGVTQSCISNIRKGRFARPIPAAQRALDRVFERVPFVALPIRGEVAS